MIHHECYGILGHVSLCYCGLVAAASGCEADIEVQPSRSVFPCHVECWAGRDKPVEGESAWGNSLYLSRRGMVSVSHVGVHSKGELCFSGKPNTQLGQQSACSVYICFFLGCMITSPVGSHVLWPILSPLWWCHQLLLLQLNMSERQPRAMSETVHQLAGEERSSSSHIPLWWIIHRLTFYSFSIVFCFCWKTISEFTTEEHKSNWRGVNVWNLKSLLHNMWHCSIECCFTRSVCSHPSIQALFRLKIWLQFFFFKCVFWYGQ